MQFEEPSESWFFSRKLEFFREVKKTHTGFFTFDLNNLMVNEVFSKKLYQLSYKDDNFFKTLTLILTLRSFHQENTILETSLNLIILKKIGDLYYLFYKCIYNKNFQLLDQWKLFLTTMMENTSENYTFFEEIKSLLSMSFESICINPDVINRILTKKTKKILYLFLEETPLDAFRLLEDFSSICIKDVNFIKLLTEFTLENQGKVLFKYFKLLKKENNELAFLKLSLILLKLLDVLFSQDTDSPKTLQKFSFSVNLLFWRLAKMLLFFHSGKFSLVLVNYMLFAFKKLFRNKSSFCEYYAKNYLFLFCSFLVVFQRNNRATRENILILNAKNKIILIIESILVIIDQPLAFLKDNFYLELIFETPNLKKFFLKLLSSEAKSKKPSNKLENLLKALNENRHFTENLVLILHFLKDLLQRLYIDDNFYTIEEKTAIFNCLMNLSNAKDFKRLSLKERFMNNNLLHVEKTTLLLECFGIIGTFSQSTLPKMQIKEVCFEKNLSPLELSSKIFVNIFFFLIKLIN